VCGIKTKSAWPPSIRDFARRRQLVFDVPPALAMAISRQPFMPNTSGTLPSAISFAISGCAIGLGEITACTSSLSMPASRTAAIQTSSKISQRVLSGSLRVGTSAIPIIAILILILPQCKLISASTSTGMLNGNSAIPTALRACLPTSFPKTALITSENPLITGVC